MTPGYRRGTAVLALACALLGAAVGAAAAPLPTVTLAAPVAPLRAVWLFDAPAHPWSAGHRGIDIAADVGQEVSAPGAGVVAFSGRVVDRGVVTVDHGGGVMTSLEPVDEAPPTGTVVARGSPLGVVGTEPGHCAPETCLHWGVRVDGAYVDPLDLLEGFGPVVLLPLTGGGASAGAAAGADGHENAPERTSDSRSFLTAAEWICETRDSVTPRIWPICASVRFS